MKIKKAAEMCQMTPRNIRFYEEVGLIQATRVDNGYRDYGKKDIERLQQIRTLRNLGIRIDSIKAYFKKEKTFYQIIQERKQELNRQRKDMDAIYQMCEQLENQKLPLSSSVTNLIEDTLQEKRYRSKKPVYGRLLSSNVKNRLSRRAVLINSIAGLLIFFCIRLFVFRQSFEYIIEEFRKFFTAYDQFVDLYSCAYPNIFDVCLYV
ncbi:MerR family transcriptional regulator [Faecalicoccus pleomorphus]|uniref:MerR family transcriptional regulator n=1 Tax=Faecalicoccus TaxID=1573536 RepID=UPI00189A4B37|nr:MerR family transcriptional regulator [Faecalicoccus pleomorphus]MDB7984647.1 MerR family transcriptional regulator [Faecalicoccus pleomorphus]